MFIGPVVELLRARVSAEAGDWFAGALQEVGNDRQALTGRWSGAGRRLGRGAIELSPREADALRAAGADLVPAGWGADECGRALLLLAALEKTPAPEQLAVVEDLYRTGEIRERQAVLRALAYLPDPERFTALAVDSVRANVVSELEAIACENPFPARHFPEPAFNQLVMKSLFNGISLRRIEGFDGRRSSELVRMVSGYASERRAAGRAVPDDVAFVLDGGVDASV
jgi:hypothetical protein